MGIINDIVDAFAPEKELYSVKVDGATYSISERGSKKSFRVNGMLYSALNRNSVYVDSYHDYFTPLPALFDRPSVLVIGLGTGTIPYQFSKLYSDRVSTEVVEIEEKCIELTRRFLSDENITFKIVHDDGAKYVKRQKGRYDIIIMDAYVPDKFPQPFHIPHAFMRDEFMDDAFNALTDDGILAINYAPDVVYLPIYLHQLKKHFKHVYRIKHIFLGNYILICSKSKDKNAIVDALSRNVNEMNRFLFKAYRSMS